MRTIDSLAISSGRMPPDITIGADVELATQEQRKFRSDEVLSDLNRDSELQTSTTHRNGDSNALQFGLGRLLVVVPPLPQVRESFKALQKWEGHVISVGNDTFSARLVPIRGEGPTEEADIYIQEVDVDDRRLLEPGAVFYWSIGYLDGPSGRKRVSELRFRRLLVWTKHELECVDQQVSEIRGLLRGD